LASKKTLSDVVLHRQASFGENQGGNQVMWGEFKKRSVFFGLLAICLLFTIHPALAGNEPPAVGGPLPSFELATPENEAFKSYLGLSDSGQFTVPQIKAQTVIIEVFSMY